VGDAGRAGAAPRARSDLDRTAYGALVRRALEHIRAGDVYQVNLSRRFTAPLGGTDPFALYERLQRASPAPFGAYVDLGDAQLLSVSPELFLRVGADPDAPGARRVETRPIKGTRPRDPVAAADRAQAAALRASEKDLAEHLMIVDLERNDLGRVARTGTVAVESLFEPYALPTLHHLESRVTALLRDDVSVAELLRATFPGGSITGAPKIRAMEVIGALEGGPRGPYCGAIGVFGPGAELTLSIAIRTAVVSGGAVEYRAGGGIVADSDPDAEFDETAWKAEAFFRAL
jgi:para-aminobenzoate synthetase component 1